MKVLLSDGSGLTSRQLATVLGRKGHQVHVLCPAGPSLTRLTRWVTKAHDVPPFGPDPYSWLEAALLVARKHKIDVFLCAQEQVAVLSAEVRRVRALGVRISVPSFGALKRVMDKVSAYDTLQEASLRQPDTVIVGSAVALQRLTEFLPAYVKIPIGTASQGVQYIASPDALKRAAAEYETQGAFVDGGRLLVQKALAGPLLMVQSIYSGGVLQAWHACIRVREGPSGGASKKTSLPLLTVREDLIRLGEVLRWDGALSMDAILVDGKPHYIDVNPRIVEPMNAIRSGVDLTDALLAISTAEEPVQGHLKRALPVDAPIQEGVSTHQFLLALLLAVEHGRLAVLAEAYNAATGRGAYAGSTEELTPISGDPMSGAVLFALVLILVIAGRPAARLLTQSNVANYALTPTGWSAILASQQP